MSRNGFRVIGMALVALLTSIGSGASKAEEKTVQQSFPIIELRQYTLHDGKRDVLVNLFEREFIEPQEEQGMKVIGTFTDLDRPNRFVWLRGFKDMDSRLTGLTNFYTGPVWKAHRDEANATMIDSDNVLLLHSPDAGAEFALPGTRPALGQHAPAGLVVGTIYYLKVPPAEAVPAFEKQVIPALKKAGVQPLAWFLTESAANNFPRLPVREGERVLVWFTDYSDVADHAAHKSAVDAAAAPLKQWFVREPETLRLKPTSRSLLRGTALSASTAAATMLIPAAVTTSPGTATTGNGVHDFDFLHGHWNVKHRRLKARGAGSKEWVEYTGTADTRPVLNGLCNVEEHRIAGQDFGGIALRCYDMVTKKWAIYWVSQRDGLLQPPVHGAFQGPEGIFEGDDTFDGRPIKVRFLWNKGSGAAARWEQSFSFDSGKSWETNWVMDFQRSE